ncbi:hypothetical protein HNY73_009857 [Argiope bruennichi]|uniref:Uncharacterized protein n=1 Tax=Argiope bruennichi TaxID=94029 RepID=A0A8T0FHK3_ARGBR|nr:hypothetical protein HNY73_009857 [Argiope bruennichi]
MECFKALCFILVLVAVAGDEEEADVTVEFSSHLTDRPIENAKNASIVTSDEIETRVPYDNDHQKLSAVYGIDPNTSSLYENFELLNTENNTVQATETNSTSNATDTKSKMKVECTPRVLPENEVYQFVKFINKFTGLTHNGTLNVTSADMIGPVPSTLTKRIDYVLILAWVFTLCCFCFGFAKSSFCKCTVEFFRNTWYEANATQHEHEE